MAVEGSGRNHDQRYRLRHPVARLTDAEVGSHGAIFVRGCPPRCWTAGQPATYVKGPRWTTLTRPSAPAVPVSRRRQGHVRAGQNDAVHGCGTFSGPVLRSAGPNTRTADGSAVGQRSRRCRRSATVTTPMGKSWAWGGVGPPARRVGQADAARRCHRLRASGRPQVRTRCPAPRAPTGGAAGHAGGPGRSGHRRGG